MSTRPEETRLGVGRALGLGACAMVTVALIVWMVTAIGSPPLRVPAIIAACLAVAIAVALLPVRWRTRSGIIAGAFVAAAGIVPMFVDSGDETPPPPPAKTVNADHLASLIRKGPFSEQLPAPVVSPLLKDVPIADQSAAQKAGAAWLEAGFADAPAAVNALIETYRTPEEAKARTAARRSDLFGRYPDSPIKTGDDTNFCIEGNGTWNCGATRGYVHVEVTVHPASNANLAIANGTVSAVLTYCDHMTLIAAG